MSRKCSVSLSNLLLWHFQEGEQSTLHTIATSIVNLQSLFGTIPHVYGLGRCAKVSLLSFVTVVQRPN